MEVDDVDYPLTEKKATKICLTQASLEAHITALKNAGWEVKPPKGTTEQSKIKNQPFGLKLVNPNPQQKKQKKNNQPISDHTKETILMQPKQIMIRKDIPAFPDPTNIQSNSVIQCRAKQNLSDSHIRQLLPTKPIESLSRITLPPEQVKNRKF